MENEKTCQNCKYFIAHYVLIKNKHLGKINCGHCACKRHSHEIMIKKLSSRTPCKNFEPAQEQTEENQSNIIEVLKKMQKSLNEIALILNKD